VCNIVGNTADAADNPEVSAGASTAGSDVTTAGVLWHSAGPGTAEQVRVAGVVSSRTAARTQAAAGEVAERGQGRLMSHLPTFWDLVLFFSVCLDPLISFFRLSVSQSVCVSVNRSVVKRLRP